MAPGGRLDGAELRAYLDERVRPHAGAWDREQRIPEEALRGFVEAGYLGALAPGEAGGRAMSALDFGLLNEALGGACSSLRSLLTVHSMVVHAVDRFGSRAQRERWLPRLASGAVLGAFALSEPDVGSDAASIQTTAAARGDGHELNGRKRWITFGEIADLLLVFARTDAGPTAFLVETSTPGVRREPIRDMLGVRASMLATIHLEGCLVPADARLGKPGLGVSFIAQSALDWGRLSVAWSSAGVARACLAVSARYAEERRQFGAPLRDHQLVRRMLTDMLVEARAARLLCERASALKDRGDPRAVPEISAAKYHASRAAARAAADAVQILGANGCSPDYPVERFLRDSKINEIIEGSSQIHQISLADYACQPDCMEP